MKQYTKAKALLESLRTIPDYRVDIGKIRYPLAEVLFMVIFALLKGNTKFKEIFGWMIYNKENPILKKIFEKDKIEIPSDSTLHRILTNTDNNALEKVFRQYFSNYVNKENIAIDGKWLNGSDANGQYTNECHKAILNILDKDTKIVFAHKFMAKNKTNEISALKQALEEDDIFSDEGQIFSFDAIQEVEVFYSKSTDIAMYYNRFNNIQSLIRVKKTLTDPKTKKQTFYTEYLMANFKTTAKDFYEKIISHWRVETYHYHLDMLMKEDEHIAYKEPFSIAILESFALNLFQLFLNANKDKKLPTGKTTMAEIKRTCKYDDYFTIQLFEQE